MTTSYRLTIDGDRLNRRLTDLAQIGRTATGGIDRVAYSAADLEARQVVQGWMEQAGMGVRLDAAGNIIGRYEGSQPHRPALATGSHIDTVPNGGCYDGAYGVLAGIEVVRTLRDQQRRLHHALEVIVFTDEESSMIGSKAMAGRIVPNPGYYSRLDGSPIQICLAQVGGDWNQITSAQRRSGEMVAFLELHVEQGPVLETAGVDIGVVEGIVGQRRYYISVTGMARHAGTTPMALRQDALVAAAQIVLAVHQIANQPGDQVATVGWLEVLPNVPNTIPGQVNLKLDIRDLSNAHLEAMMVDLQGRLGAIAAATGTEIQIQPRLRNDPAPAAPRIQSIIASVCQDLGLSTLSLPSRASHDAQEMAALADMGMIFVPSQAGISHADTEYTSPQQCALGAEVLLHTLLKLDQLYQTQPAKVKAADFFRQGSTQGTRSGPEPLNPSKE
jgi:N-carbamoyl-L-amino-acid hydrolase